MLIPTVEKRHFVADQDAFPPFGRRLVHAQSSGKALQFFMTSGTTGQGQELHGQTTEEFKVTGEVYAHMFRWAGMAPGQQVLLTLPLTMMAGGRLESFGAESYGLTVYPAGNYDARKKLELLARFKPQGMVGTTSYFGHLSAMSEAKPPAPSIKYLFGGGEARVSPGTSGSRRNGRRASSTAMVPPSRATITCSHASKASARAGDRACFTT